MSWQSKLLITYTSMANMIEHAVNGIHQLMLDAGWTLYDEISSTTGQTDRVYRSTGEDGTESLFIRLSQTNATEILRFGIYTWWNSTTHAGYNGVRGGYLGQDEWPHGIQAPSGVSFTGWLAANKNGLTICQKYGTEYGTVYVGLLENRFVASTRSGRTTLSSGVTVAASGSTVISVVTNNNIEVGQKIFVINQTNGSNAGNLLRCTVIAKATGQLTVTNDAASATTFDSGALVGGDPQPNMIFGLTENLGGGTWYGGCPSKGAMFLYGGSTTRKTGAAQTLITQMQYAVHIQSHYLYLGDTSGAGVGADVTPADPYAWDRTNPNIGGYYGFSPYVLVGGWTNGTINTDKWWRGSTERICQCGRAGTLASEDNLVIGTAKWMALYLAGTSGTSNTIAVKTTE
jgi:hypothetical protein